MSNQNNNTNMLEIFCGTKSVSKVAEPRGYSVYSIDNRKSTKPTWCGDLLTWKGYKAADFPVPDFIWASPPCTTFSTASGGFYRKLDKKTGQLVTQKDKEARGRRQNRRGPAQKDSENYQVLSEAKPQPEVVLREPTWADAPPRVGERTEPPNLLLL